MSLTSLALILSVAAADAPSGPAPLLPTALPDSVRLRPDGAVDIWLHGQRWTRALSDGAFIDGETAAWKLAGGWELDGPTVRRDGRVIDTLAGRLLGASVTPDGLWLRDERGLFLAGRPERMIKVRRGQEVAFAPFADGVAIARRDDVRVLDGDHHRRCLAPGRAHGLTASPDGSALLLLGSEGIAVRDKRCHLVAGTPITGLGFGFIDADRLLVVGPDGELVVLGWPSLEVVHRTAPSVDQGWELAQGPAGPVFTREDDVFDPQNGTTVTLPRGSLILREQGLAVSPVGAEIQVSNLAGGAPRSLPADLDGDPSLAVVDGARIAVTDGFTVAQASPDGEFDRWEIADPVRALQLLPDGSVIAETKGLEQTMLRPGTPTPSHAPFTAYAEDMILPDGGRLHLAFGEGGAPRAIQASSGPAQVFDTATLAALGPAIPVWFEQAALSPDGSLLAGLAKGRVRAFEVATGRDLWSADAVEDPTDLEVFETFLLVEGRRETRLYDLSTGEVRWTVAPVSDRRSNAWSAIAIRSASGSWRSDAWGGASPLPAWTGTAPALSPPTPGEPIADRVDASSLADRAAQMGPLRSLPALVERDLCEHGYVGDEPRVSGWLATHCAAQPSAAPESWSGTAEVGGQPDPAPQRLRPGRWLLGRPHVSLRAILHRLLPFIDPRDERGPDDPTGLSRWLLGRPSVIVYGPMSDLPDHAPRGVRLVRLVVGPPGPERQGEDILTTPEIEDLLGLGPGPEALILGATGRLLARGCPDDILRLAERAGLEEVEDLPTETLTPAWTYQAPAAIERLVALTGGDVLVATSRSFAVLSRDGEVRWTDAVGAEDVVDLATGRSLDAGGRAPLVVSGEAWTRVPGGWCRSSMDCVENDPAATFRVDGKPAWMGTRPPGPPHARQTDGADRILTGDGWSLDGISRAVQVNGSHVLVQLGSEAGPWAFVGPGGQPGPLLGFGWTVSSADGLVALARGATVRAFAVP